MGKPVMNPDFWRGRLQSASELRYAVYSCPEEDWNQINEHHYKILTQYIDVKNSKVLEAGCGFGRWSPLFENYTGVDISPDFIRLAKENYPLHSDNFLVGDLKTLPFPDKHFDWCFHISVKEMIRREIGNETWGLIEKELLRVSKKVLTLEYSSSLPSNPNRDNIEILF